MRLNPGARRRFSQAGLAGKNTIFERGGGSHHRTFGRMGDPSRSVGDFAPFCGNNAETPTSMRQRIVVALKCGLAEREPGVGGAGRRLRQRRQQ